MNKLNFEVLPNALHGVNIRSERGISEWDIIRKKVYRKYKHTCCICGKKHMKCHAHEVWKLSINSRTSKGIQTLVNIICVCEECHNVIHIVRLATVYPNKVDEAFKYYSNINQITLQQTLNDYKYMAEKFQKTSAIKDWKINLSLLDNDAYLQVFNIT